MKWRLFLLFQKKSQKNLVISKKVPIFAAFTVNESHSFRRASGQVAQSKVGHFLCPYFKILAVAYT